MAPVRSPAQLQTPAHRGGGDWLPPGAGESRQVPVQVPVPGRSGGAVAKPPCAAQVRAGAVGAAQEGRGQQGALRPSNTPGHRRRAALCGTFRRRRGRPTCQMVPRGLWTQDHFL